ncbi:MAG: amidophosphoribosyltransferase [bacterium]
MLDKFQEECGVIGIYGHPEAAKLAYLGLYALQHRGQESAGIVTCEKSRLFVEKGMGLVADIFTEDCLARLPGDIGIGHVRYSTAGSSLLKNAQPIVVDYAKGPLAVAHNGNLVNSKSVRSRLEKEGSIFQSTTDTEVIIHLIARSRKEGFVDRLIEALMEIKGAYSLVILTENSVIGVRDPYGVRPLILGKVDGCYVLASETCALDLIEGTYIRDVEPGEIVIINSDGIESRRLFSVNKTAFCIFELIYVARSDSIFFEKSAYAIRKEFGRQLARETAVEADVVIPVPDSGTYAALGYAEESGIVYEKGLIRNNYVGRTFIEPKQSIRHFGVKVKLNVVKDVIFGKRVVMIDDSIVRGTTSRKLVTMLQNAGAKEVHMRVSSPPTIYPCYYGIDTPYKKELIASKYSVDGICTFLGATTLAYLSLEGLFKSVEFGKENFCTACFSGKYPIKLPCFFKI